MSCSNAPKVTTGEKKLERFAENIIFPKEVKSRGKLKDELNCGRKFEPVARKSYADITKLKLNHEICVCETGIVSNLTKFILARCFP